MADRYQTTTREVPVDQPRNTVYVPGDPAGALDMHEPDCGIRARGECSCPAGWSLGDIDRPTDAHWAELGRRIRVQLKRTPEEWAALKMAREQSSRGPRPVTGDLNSQHRVTEHPAGFRVRERGALGAKVMHTYRCYVHGPFDVEVPRDDVPDSVPCPEEDMRWDCEANAALVRCKFKATWAGSSCGIGHAAGEVMS